jgi:molecular chaperone DnaK
VGGNSPADPSNPGGSKKTGVALQVKLPCATLDDVRARHPELSTRRFFLRTATPRPVETPIRLTALLSDGKHCFRANAIVEKVHQAGESPGRSDAGMTLWLARMDDPGRELVAWMGGQPPPLLKQPAATEAAASAATPAKKAVTPTPAGKPAAAEKSARPAPMPTPPSRAPAPGGGKTVIEDDFEVTLDHAETVLPAPTATTAAPAGASASPPPAAPAPTPPAVLPLAADPAAWPVAPDTAAKPPPAAWPVAPDTAAKPTPAAPQATARPVPPAPEPPPKAPPAATRIPGASTSPGAVPPPSNNESRRPAPPPLPRPTLAPGTSQPQPAVIASDEPDQLPQARPSKPTGPVIGIDLGTTNSCAAVVKDGKPFVIPSREGYNTIPSVVALSDKGKLMVGHPARSQLLINPRNTVYGAKRLIGRQFKSPVVTDLLGRFSYEIVSGPRGEAAVKMGDQVFSLQKISALVLSEVKDLAERWLGAQISRAVITVPAYYNDNQRQAVRAAGALAGLDVERIVNEPTAAAIAFAQGRTLEQRVMVYDLGGGTFDTSVLELHGNVYEVISTGGDTFLGGVDFDRALVQDLLVRFREKHGIAFEGDRVALQRITDAAERAKIALSERLTTQVSVPFVTMVGDKGYNLDTQVTRAELEKLTAQLIDRTLRVCDDVLNNCGLKPADIGEILLVGGQSRMPLVRAKLREFSGKEPSKTVHPDEAVALGAALLAHSMQSGDIGGMVLVDVLPMSIGVGLPGGRFKKVVERNTSLPHKKTYSIWTSQDNQKTLEIPVFQGEADRAQQNEYLGTLVVPDLPAGIKGSVVFDINFAVSPESILTITAEERGTRRSVSATFSTQDSPEAVKQRLSGAPGAEPERLDAPEPGKSGWMSRLFGRRVS